MDLIKDDIVGKEFLQNCGDTLLVLQKTNKKLRPLSYYPYLYECIFLKYPKNILAEKKNIVIGNVFNPEIEQVEFINNLFEQNCGDTLKVIEKTEKKQGSAALYKCQFQKYPYEIEVVKKHILEGSVLNPKIEEEEFIGTVFKQNCDHSLKVLEKTENRQGTSSLYKCQFLETNEIVYATKSGVLRGEIRDPSLKKDIIGKTFPQNCGDDLIVLELSDQRVKEGGSFLYKCQFIKYPSISFNLRSNILRGCVENLSIPYKTKEGLEKFLKDNFVDRKANLSEVAKLLDTTPACISAAINKFDLRDYIVYNFAKLETEIRDYIVELLGSEKVEDRGKFFKDKDGKYFEIDIFIKDKNVGIEVNGSYWHSETFKSTNFHQEKTLNAGYNNLRLIHIWEYEWRNLDSQELIKAYIKSTLGIFEVKIGARVCSIREIDSKIYSKFCKANHIQGYCAASIKIGLFHKEELIQVISFSKPRFTDKYEYECIRECSKVGYQIMGGKDRLWKYFLKKYNPESVVSYCDFSKFTGNSYKRLGFKLERLNRPGFVWFDLSTGESFWRSPYKHEEMKKKYLKIYDCGQLVFCYNKK